MLAADEIDQTVEPLCVETRGENLLAVHFTAFVTECEILLASADLFTAIELGAAAAQEAHRVEQNFGHYSNDSAASWIDNHRRSRIDVARMLSLRRATQISSAVGLDSYRPRKASWTSGGLVKSMRPIASMSCCRRVEQLPFSLTSAGSCALIAHPNTVRGELILGVRARESRCLCCSM